MKYLLLTVSVFIFCQHIFSAAPTQDLLEKIDVAKQSLSGTTNTEARIDLMCEIADLYYTVNPDSGLAYGNAALSLAYANNYLRGKINAHDRLGFLYQTLGKFDHASEHLTSALQLSELSPDSIKTIDILNHLGSMNYNQNTEKALAYYLRALQLSQTVNDNRRIASSYNHIGMIYMQQKNYAKALEHNLKSLRAWIQIDSMKTTGVLSDIGNIYYRLLDYSSALAYYERAHRIAEKNSDYLALGYTLANSGIVLIEMGRMTEAIQKLQESLKYRQLLDNKEGISNSLALLARWYYRQRDYDHAYSYAKQNMELARSIGIKSSVFDAYQIIVEILTAQQQYSKALQYKTEWVAYQDSVTENENSALLTRMEVLYETERKETENKLLKEQQAKTEAILQQQIIITISVAVLLLLSSIATILLYRSNKLKQEINKTLLKQKDIIEEQKHQMETLNGVKDKLFSIVTHDLRGPISSLKMFITYLRDETLDQQMIKDYTQQSSATIDRITDMMENVLQWSKSQWKGLSAEPTQINLHQIAKEKIRLMETMAQKKNLTVHNLIPPAAEAYADLQMIQIVFRNLLTNAIKFTEQSGTIRIRCADYDDYVEVSVEDSGIGMSKEQIDTAFSFEHSPKAGTNEELGTGLGLLLCKEFVEKNGGTIKVESVLGAGSVFTFTVPRSKKISEGMLNQLSA
ncbi:MAG: tetratricopeptide repeat-containing sensor histidine kinase [Bacteroidota bacterium]